MVHPCREVDAEDSGPGEQDAHCEGESGNARRDAREPGQAANPQGDELANSASSSRA